MWYVYISAKIQTAQEHVSQLFSASKLDVELLSCATPFGCRVPPRDSHVLAVQSAAQQFFCRVSANFTQTDTQRTWLLNGRPFNIKSSLVRLRFGTKELSISHVQTWMGGWFQCCAKDKCSEEILMVVFGKRTAFLSNICGNRFVSLQYHPNCVGSGHCHLLMLLGIQQSR